MVVEQLISKIKAEKGFCDKVGMILIHNGVVRGISRDGKKVKELHVSCNYPKIRQIREYYEKQKGIFKILIEAREGCFRPGEDLLYIVVAGDVRENVKKVLSDVLEEVKSSAVYKQEIVYTN